MTLNKEMTAERERVALLSAESVGKCFEAQGRTIWPVRGANLTLYAGEMVTLRGRSGSGKSTLINTLLGLWHADEGRVMLMGEGLAGQSDQALSALRNRYVGYVPQSAAMLATLSVLDNVRLPWYLSEREPEPQGRAMALLERVGLAALAHERPARLSGGERRRVALVRALMTEPRIIVADEPTASLDEESALTVVTLLREAADRGAAVLSVTHDAVGLELSHRICQMADGRLSPMEGLPAGEQLQP